MSKKEREICALDLFDEFVCLRSNPVRNDNINSAERPGLKTGAENWIFWSEIGSGFGEPGRRIPRNTRPEIQVPLKILSCFVENIAAHSLPRKCISWSKSLQSLRLLESWNRCTCKSCTWLTFLLWSSVFKCGVAHTWRRSLASLNYERFHGHQVKLK